MAASPRSAGVERTRGIGGDAVDGGAVGLAAHQDDRHLAAGAPDDLVVEHGAAEDDAVRAQLQQRLHGVCFPRRRAVAAVDEHLVAGARGLLLDAGHHVREEGVVQVGDHHAHEVRAPLHEAARHRVRPVPELGRRLVDGLALLGLT
jgi:hypothetical protein